MSGLLLPAAMLDEDEDERVDEAALRQLTEMGFPESRASKALRLNQYVGASPSFWRCWELGLVSHIFPPKVFVQLSHFLCVCVCVCVCSKRHLYAETVVLVVWLDWT
jgi:hypothetical protein